MAAVSSNLTPDSAGFRGGCLCVFVRQNNRAEGMDAILVSGLGKLELWFIPGDFV